MTKRCKGCGALLQNENKNEIGYTPKMDADYCQRCYRLSHYGDVMISMQQGIEANQTLEKINRIDGTVFWVVDLFNFEESLISRLNQKLPGKNRAGRNQKRFAAGYFDRRQIKRVCL